MIEPDVAQLLAEGEQRRSARERDIMDKVRAEEGKEIKSFKLGKIGSIESREEGSGAQDDLMVPVAKSTDRERTQAKLRRELGKPDPRSTRRPY